SASAPPRLGRTVGRRRPAAVPAAAVRAGHGALAAAGRPGLWRLAGGGVRRRPARARPAVRLAELEDPQASAGGPPGARPPAGEGGAVEPGGDPAGNPSGCPGDSRMSTLALAAAYCGLTGLSLAMNRH